MRPAGWGAELYPKPLYDECYVGYYVRSRPGGLLPQQPVVRAGGRGLGCALTKHIYLLPTCYRLVPRQPRPPQVDAGLRLRDGCAPGSGHVAAVHLPVGGGGVGREDARQVRAGRGTGMRARTPR